MSAPQASSRFTSHPPSRPVAPVTKVGLSCQKLSVIEDAVERDNFMSPEESVKFGIIDEVVTSRPSEDTDDDDSKDEARELDED